MDMKISDTMSGKLHEVGGKRNFNILVRSYSI